MLICFTGTVGGGLNPVGNFFTGWNDYTGLVTGATPLEIMGGTDIHNLPTLGQMFLGVRGGAIGECCILALLIGFVYLVVRRVIHFETPLIFVATVFVLSLIVTNDPVLALYHVLAGGLVLGAVFMATDYVTTPITRTGKMIFALGCGIITFLIRFYGTYPEGVSFSILLMNILSPYIEKWTAPKALGGKKA
jgi:electron transport complex protein RnfD